MVAEGPAGVRCPTCGAESGEACSGRPRSGAFHRERELEVGRQAKRAERRRQHKTRWHRSLRGL